ncbi:hypothetical protein J6590_085541 [Homalodisca vitripennis]|nr:hypothetical protein J6590_085541 [Homalodisca vitripennis]
MTTGSSYDDNDDRACNLTLKVFFKITGLLADSTTDILAANNFPCVNGNWWKVTYCQVLAASKLLSLLSPSISRFRMTSNRYKVSLEIVPTRSVATVVSAKL